MNLIYKIIVIFAFLYGYHVAAQEIQKCWLGDSTCERESYLKIAVYVIEYGVAELGIPPLNPMPIYNIGEKLLGMITATVNKGECYGIDTCRLLSFVNNATSFRKILEVKCGRLAIEGSYTMTTDSYFWQLIGSVFGCGNLSIVAEDWYFKFDYPYKFVKGNDGKIYLEADFKAGNYISKVLKNFTVLFDNIVWNGKDITKKINDFLNRFWKFVLKTIGKPFHDAALKYFFIIYQKFYGGISATDTYYDDLTKYVE